MKRLSVLAFCAAATALCTTTFSQTAWSPPNYTITPLSVPSGATAPIVNAITNGNLIGGYCKVANLNTGILWQSPATTGITLPALAAGKPAIVSKISPAGVPYGSATSSVNTVRTVSWTTSGSAISTLFAGSGDGGSVKGVSDNETVIGTETTGTYTGVMAFLKSPTTTMFWNVNGAGIGRANAISPDANFVVGARFSSTSSTSGWYTYKGGTPIEIVNPYPNSGAPDFRAVNNNGQIAVNLMVDWVNGYWRGNILQPDFPGSTTYSYVVIPPKIGSNNSLALDMNCWGIVLGTSSGVTNPWFIYKDGTTFDLMSYVQNATGWSSIQLTCINDRGYIGGRGIYNGEATAFVLTPDRLTP
jgi:hypothetical protein